MTFTKTFLRGLISAIPLRMAAVAVFAAAIGTQATQAQDGKIVKSGGKELAFELEEKGYDWIKEEIKS